MNHLPPLIQDLGLILVAAAVVTLLFKKLKQPVVLGYLIAGFLVGPHFELVPTVKASGDISTWAEIGVIFLLFGLGLEFSFKRLASVGKSASIATSIEILVMLGLGYLFGRLLGWSTMDSMFLGGIVSISSTAIIVRAFEELNLKGKNLVSHVFSILIIEDLIAILLLVLLSSIALTRSLSGIEVVESVGKLGFFLVLWFLVGIYLLPLLFKKLKDQLSDETLLIVSLGLCLMMVIIASEVGFSPALGAFVMGSLLAETPSGVRIESLIHSVKNLFSAIFFVSVGMMINPQSLIDNFGIILMMSLLVVTGKTLGVTMGSLIAGRNFRGSVQAGMSLAQIGEFSFIIATLGLSLKVTSEFLYPIAVAVSAITTFTTPYLIKYSEPFSAWLEQRIPVGLREALMRYEQAMTTASRDGVLSLIWKEYGMKISSNGVIVVAITLAMSRFAGPYVEAFLSGPNLKLVLLFLTMLLAAPFLWAIFFGWATHLGSYAAETLEQFHRLQLGISILRFLIGSALVGFIISSFTSLLAVSGFIVIGLTVLAAFFFSRFYKPIYMRIENRFISHLNENDRAKMEQAARIPTLAPWNANLTEFTVSPNSDLVMKTLEESKIKENFGVTVAMIERGDQRICAPNRKDVLLPYDKVFVIGTEEQLSSMASVVEKKVNPDLPRIEGQFGLACVTLKAEDSFINRTIRDSGLRESVNGLIVGLEREGKRYLNPDSLMILKEGDLVWMVGEISLIKAIGKS